MLDLDILKMPKMQTGIQNGFKMLRVILDWLQYN